MDIFSHALWTGALSRVAQDRQPRFRPLLSALWGVLPDLFAFVPMFVLGIWGTLTAPGSERFHFFTWRQNADMPLDLAAHLYNYSHSLVIFLAVFLLITVVRKALKPSTAWKDLLPYNMLGWPLHILIDIPLHRLSFFATPFLFPLSSYRFPYGISWGVPWFMVCNLVGLLAMYAWLWRKRRTADPRIPTP